MHRRCFQPRCPRTHPQWCLHPHRQSFPPSHRLTFQHCRRCFQQYKIAKGGSSRLCAWARYDRRAMGFKTTIDPARARATARLSLDLSGRKLFDISFTTRTNGDILEDLDAKDKGLTTQTITGPLPGRQGGRDITTEFYYRLGKWEPYQDVPATPCQFSRSAVQQATCRLPLPSAQPGHRQSDQPTP